MSIITDKNDIKILKEAGRRLAFILNEVIKAVRAEVREKELDVLAEKLIRENGDEPAFLNYKPSFTSEPYPATLCISVNDEVVHGVPQNRKLRDGDIVGLDLGLKHEGIIVDMAKTVAVGEIDKETAKLLRVTEEALHKGIAVARAGNRVGDIGNAIGSFVEENGFSIVRELGGHGVGRKVHEDPFIPNFGKKGTGEKLISGMVLALEPIVNAGKPDVSIAHDGFTYKTKDGSLSAHFEHTILITKDGAEIITK